MEWAEKNPDHFQKSLTAAYDDRKVLHIKLFSSLSAVRLVHKILLMFFACETILLHKNNT